MQKGHEKQMMVMILWANKLKLRHIAWLLFVVDSCSKYTETNDLV